MEVASNSRKRSSKRAWVAGVKFFVTGVLLATIIAKVDWGALWMAVKGAKIFWIVPVFIAMAANVLLSAYKWALLLRIHGIILPFWHLARYYFIGGFFNNFLPSTIGGDSFRIYKTIQDSGLKEEPIIAVLADRLTGVFALISLGTIGGLVSYGQTGSPIAQLATLIGLSVLAGSGLMLTLATLGKERLGRLKKRYVPKQARVLLTHLKDYGMAASLTLRVLLVSFLFQVFFLSYRLLLLYSAGAFVSIFELAVIMSISTLVALIPISINGYGLLDGSVIFLMMRFGVDYEIAVIFMVLVRGLQIPLSLIGGGVYLMDRRAAAK